MKKLVILVLLLLFIPISIASAHQPIREQESENILKGGVINFDHATEIKDPSNQSLAVYGSLENPNEIDLYKFTASNNTTIPVELLVPVRVSNKEFFPSYAFIEPSVDRNGEYTSYENLIIPSNYKANIIETNFDRGIFFEPFSLEKLFHGNEQYFDLNSGLTYYIAVFDPIGVTGDYSLGIGNVENFSDVSFVSILKEVFLIKMAVLGGSDLPWLDILGLFLFIAGFVIALGAVTVIDLHGFLARKSKYWTIATIRAHKITKPLIWLGTVIATIGGTIYYRYSGLSSTATFHLILLIVLVANGLFLSFKISPYLLKQEKSKSPDKLLPKNMQRNITISFIISFSAWWTALFLLVWHVLVAR